MVLICAECQYAPTECAKDANNLLNVKTAQNTFVVA
jgi:hypothetical protein